MKLSMKKSKILSFELEISYSNFISNCVYTQYFVLCLVPAPLRRPTELWTTLLPLRGDDASRAPV